MKNYHPNVLCYQARNLEQIGDTNYGLLAAPNSSEIGVRVVEEISGAVVEAMLDTDIPAATQLLSPRNFMNNGATAAAVAYDCSGVYVVTDY